MEVTILDGYVDEPSCLGVPPYMSPYPRYLAGAVLDAGHQPSYVTIDQVRAGHALRGDLLVILSGAIVPGRYLRGMPISEKEVMEVAAAFPNPVVLGGPLARFRYRDPTLESLFHHVAVRDVDALVHDLLAHDAARDRDRTLEEWNRWALLGAPTIEAHPDHPNPLTVELDTTRGCVRYFDGGCSFCIEPLYGKPVFRSPGDVVAEVRELARHGAVNFRLGGQTDFFSYLGKGVGQTLTPHPNLEAIEALLRGIREAAPRLRVLHTDNADPAVAAAHPEEAKAALDVLVSHGTSGNTLSLGLETADPAVIEANNLNTNADEVEEVVRMVNEAGRERGENGMPRLLPGLNFVAGLDGETARTYEINMEFLRGLKGEGLLLRRINIRQVAQVRQEFNTRKHYREVRRFKDAVRREIDHEMLKRLVPKGSVLRDVYLEVVIGGRTYGRQIGTYPLLAVLPYDAGTDRFVDVIVLRHGFRSVGAVEYPLDLNTAPMKALRALPGVGKKRAARIVRARPLRSEAELAEALGDPALARQLLEAVAV
jgi:radical SAM superfamily enzyme with C-terminal helix-hairpin-helix motif